MTKSSSNSQRFADLTAQVPAMVEKPGRHRQVLTLPVPVPRGSQKSSGVVPTPMSPFPPLQSGGWYHGPVLEELAPGRYAANSPGDRSVSLALVLTLIAGPLGLCYGSVAGGVVCTALTILAVLAAGPQVLLVVWPLAMLLAAITASQRHSRYTRT